MPVPASDFMEFREALTPELMMAVLIDRYGRKIAEELEDEIWDVVQGKKLRPTVTWPKW